MHTIGALEPRNDVVHASYWLVVIFIDINVKRQGWPDIQPVPCRCSACTGKLQIQAMW